ncbi:Fic family protein [Natronolimnobius sp. AArcel1]|uniref:Fic family protein n=1 Tax=Natronolimnobius sp. AArcel1 TaxID=1679093 RepID=UPI0013EDC1BA|nr:Fic family protein [Natronolimnobius sp. AArcel1]NGM71288.1 Fic family protein [Natronolimnobius sp. AArcel1]
MNIGNDTERSAANQQDVQGAHNYAEAIRTGFDALGDGGQIDQELLCNLHQSLLVDVRSENKRPGNIQDEIPVLIGPDNPIKSVRFVPANPNSVALLFDQLVLYIKNSNYPPLIDIAITHYQFETIHPSVMAMVDSEGSKSCCNYIRQISSLNRICTYQHISTLSNRVLRPSTRCKPARRVGIVDHIVLNAIAAQAVDAYQCGIQIVSPRIDYRDRFPNSLAVRDVMIIYSKSRIFRPRV